MDQVSPVYLYTNIDETIFQNYVLCNVRKITLTSKDLDFGKPGL